MKRLLSLLVVIAMVVSLIPNVFAAKEEIDMDELLGRLVVLEDISLIEVKMDEGSDGKIYQWTPAADEEATELNLSWYPETAVLNVTATTGETTVSATTTPVEDGEGYFGELTLPIVAGQLVEIEVSEANGAAAEAYIYGSLSGYPAGHETNPIALGMVMAATIEKASWFTIKNFVGDLIITGEGAFNVNFEGETFAAVDGVVTLPVNAPMFAGEAMFQIDAAGAYTFSLSYPIGSMENPAQLVIGENIADIEAGSQGYMYIWTATEEGTLKITMPEGGWSYQLNNLTSCAYGDTQWSDGDPVANPAEVAVAAGDEIQLIVNTYDPAAPWQAPAGQLTINAELVLPEPPAPSFEITQQPVDAIVKANEAAVFTVVAEGEGLSYKWQYKTNVEGADWKNATDSTGDGRLTNTLTITKTPETKHGYSYRCIITTANGEEVITEAGTLLIPFLQVKASNARVKINAPAVYTVGWSLPGATYKWQYKTNAVGADWKNATDTTGSGRLTETLTVTSTPEGKNGYSYRCIITWNGETFETPAYLLQIVEDPAVIVEQTAGDISANSGEWVELTVNAEGTGIKYQWQVKKPDGMWANTKMTGYNTNTLKLKAYDFRSGYQYKCKITTPAGTAVNQVYTEPATLTVIPAAAISQQPSDSVVNINETAAFHVEATGLGLTYQWQYSKNGGKTFMNTSLTGATTATLEVKALTSRNNYLYRCKITNEFGGDIYTEAALLTIQDPTLAITQQPTDITTVAGETVQFVIKATADSIVYQWQYSTDNGATWKATTMEGAKTDTVSVGALAGRNGWQYRCVVTSSTGETLTSEAATLIVQ